MKIAMIFAALAGFATAAYAEDTYYTYDYRQALKVCRSSKMVRDRKDVQGRTYYVCAYKRPAPLMIGE